MYRKRSMALIFIHFLLELKTFLSRKIKYNIVLIRNHWAFCCINIKLYGNLWTIQIILNKDKIWIILLNWTEIVLLNKSGTITLPKIVQYILFICWCASLVNFYCFIDLLYVYSCQIYYISFVFLITFCTLFSNLFHPDLFFINTMWQSNEYEPFPFFRNSVCIWILPCNYGKYM
jgi:hypothetical protein